MSRDVMDLQEAAEPRRGGRVRKTVEKYQPTQGAKRTASGDDSEQEPGSDSELSELDDEPQTKRKSTTKAGAGVAKEKSKKSKAPVKRRKVAVEEGEAVGGEVGVKDDSPLFNALLNPDIALKTTVEDWVESYQAAAGDDSAEKEAVHQLVLFLVRCCGLSVDVNEDEAMDMDGIQDVVERIEEESAQTTAATYPLINKSKPLRAFRRNLISFTADLVNSLSLTPLLYQTTNSTSHTAPLLTIIQTWLHTMSSSALRPLRHTSTFIALKINSALCEAASVVSKDLSLKQRQKEAEAKKTTGDAKTRRERVKEAEGKVKAAHAQKTRLEEMMGDTVDGVFVHRLRDTDAAVRTDCLKELGVWIESYPSLYGDEDYLGYFIRGCNDPDQHARQETVKALAALYSKDSFANTVRSGTHRLASRLIEMALRDIETTVRVRALQTITLIDATGFLEDEDIEERDQVIKLLFDSDQKVRRAVGGYVANIWKERAERLCSDARGAVGNKKKRLADAGGQEKVEAYLGCKALVRLMVETSTMLDEEQGREGNSAADGNGLNAGSELVAAATATEGAITRAIAVVESLDVPPLQDYTQLAEYLLLDHSGHEDDAWLLDEEEEAFGLQILCACVILDEEDEEDKTKSLIKLLPRLIAKTQTDAVRMSAVLELVKQLKLEVYLDLRKTSAFEALWDDITKTFLSQTSAPLLTSAIGAINFLCRSAVGPASALSASNDKKLSELSEALFTSLRDSLAGEDIAVITLEEDLLTTVQAIMLRLTLLAKARDVSKEMMDDEGDQTTAWDICCAFVERAGLGYKEEAQLMEYAIQTVFLQVAWMFKSIIAEDAAAIDKAAALKEKRDKALALYQDIVLRDRSNALGFVKQQAFIALLNLHILFSPRSNAPAAKAAPLEMADELQHKLGGAFMAAVERYGEHLEMGSQADNKDKSGFYQQLAVLTAAIRTGVVDIEHAKEPLSHYGRFEPMYDAITRKLLDVLRDEGIYNRQAGEVQAVCAEALQNSFTHFLDTDEADAEPKAPVALASLLKNAFIITGTHFSVIKQLHPSDAADFHISCLDYITAKIGKLAQQERSNKSKEVKQRLAAKRGQAMLFWKCLSQLLAPINGRDALRLRDKMEGWMDARAGFDRQSIASSRHKSWEAYKAYEKKLVQIMSKDNNLKAASQRVVREQATRATQVQGGKGKKRSRQEVDDEGDEQEDEDAGRERSESLTLTPDEPAPARPAQGKRTALARRDSMMDLDTAEADKADVMSDEDAAEQGEEGDDLDLPTIPNMEDDDIDLDLELENDLDFANADFPILTQGERDREGSRARSVSVEPAQKKKRIAMVF